MLEDGLSFPLRGDSAAGRIFIGGLLGIFSVLVLPAFVLFGYLLRVLAASARGEEEPPAFEDWGGLLADGLKGMVVALAYAVLPILLLVVAAGVTGAGAASGDRATAGVLGVIGVVGLLVAFLALVVLYYLLPAALTNMALEDDVGAAFDLGTLKRALLSVDYLIAWLLPFVIGFVANVLSVFVVVVTLGLGALVLPFVQFYVQVSVFYMFGRAFGSAVGVGDAAA